MPQESMTTPLPPSPARRPSTRRDAVLSAVREAASPVGATDIAATLGVHANTVRFHLDALIADGRIETVTARHGDVGRPRKLYRAVIGMDRSRPTNDRLLAEILLEQIAEEPDVIPRAIEIGRRWGHAHADRVDADFPDAPRPSAVRARLIALLEALEFAPTRPAGRSAARAIDLHHCPFLTAAEDRPNIVCSLHLGLMRGALERWNASMTVTDLVPFAAPDLCRAHLGPHGQASAAPVLADEGDAVTALSTSGAPDTGIRSGQ